MSRECYPLSFRGSTEITEELDSACPIDPALFGAFGRLSIAQCTDGLELVKFHPDDGTVIENHETDVEVIIDVAKVHFDKLKEFGLNVAEPYSRQVGVHPRIPKLVIYTNAPYIDGYELSYEIAQANQALVQEQAIDPLLAYYNWILDSSSPYYVRDIAVLNQFVFGHRAGVDEEDKLWLVDLDPRVTHLPADWQGLHSDLCDFDEIFEAVGIGEGESGAYNALNEKWYRLMFKKFAQR